MIISRTPFRISLAGGSTVREAVTGAKDYITAAIGHAWRLGGGQGPVNHLAPLLQAGRAGCMNKRQ